jgi:hypothetical protein
MPPLQERIQGGKIDPATHEVIRTDFVEPPFRRRAHYLAAGVEIFKFNQAAQAISSVCPFIAPGTILNCGASS